MRRIVCAGVLVCAVYLTGCENTNQKVAPFVGMPGDMDVHIYGNDASSAQAGQKPAAPADAQPGSNQAR